MLSISQISRPEFPAILYGGDYNPEQWPDEVWEEDVRLMREAGVNCVSVAIFAWGRLEPVEGTFEFAWLDRLLDLLETHEIRYFLATATASIPAWMAHTYPECQACDRTGQPYTFGSRQNYSPSSPLYRECCARLVRELAQRYGQRSGLLGWHVNNEYGCHVPADFSPAAVQGFRRWLQEKYGTVEALNAAWGTEFWAQRYTGWEQISALFNSPTYGNPTQEQDFKRFYAGEILACYLNEAAILREITPDVPLTTNNFLNLVLDDFEFARHQDFVSFDHYPDPEDPVIDLGRMTSSHTDFFRGIGGDKPVILMEQATTQVSWRPANKLKRPGLMRLLSYTTLAHGADGIMFFQWRASLAGAEKYHSAMVPHAGPDRGRVFREVCELGRELARLADLRGSRVAAEVGIIYDKQSQWCVSGACRPGTLDYRATMEAAQGAFWARNIPTRIVSPYGDFAGLKVLVAPLQHMQTRAQAEAVCRFVEAGGTFVTTYFSGVVDENDHVYPGGYPGLMRELLGIAVEEWDSRRPDWRVAVDLEGRQVEGRLWAEVLSATTAEVRGTYQGEFYAGRPAVTCNAFGAGKAWYLSTEFAPEVLADLIERIAGEAKVDPVLRTPIGVEAILRTSERGTFLFLLNYTDAACTVPLGGWHGQDLLGSSRVKGELTLAPLGVAVIAVEA